MKSLARQKACVQLLRKRARNRTSWAKGATAHRDDRAGSVRPKTTTAFFLISRCPGMDGFDVANGALFRQQTSMPKTAYYLHNRATISYALRAFENPTPWNYLLKPFTQEASLLCRPKRQLAREILLGNQQARLATIAAGPDRKVTNNHPHSSFKSRGRNRLPSRVGIIRWISRRRKNYVAHLPPQNETHLLRETMARPSKEKLDPGQCFLRRSIVPPSSTSSM